MLLAYLYDAHTKESRSLTGFSNENTLWIYKSGEKQIKINFSKRFQSIYKAFFGI